MRSRSSARSSLVLIGAGAQRASFRRCGRGACSGSSVAPDITSRTSGSQMPAEPAQELRFWYQYYFHTTRGRNGLTENRGEFCKLLWKLWSPGWAFDVATFERTAMSFANVDFVDVVIHS